MKCLKELAIPLIWLYNYCMLDMKDMKKELVIELNMIGEWFSRGDRGMDEWYEDVNVDKSRRGIEGCMGRVDELLEGKSIMIECEEEVFCIGSNNSKEINKVEIDFMKGKIELLER